ncbi:MAG: NF038129 family PEP-CTERM protein, partial [Candidatus Saccharimonadales bacterium]
TLNAAQPQNNVPANIFSEATTAFVTAIAPQGPGKLQLSNVRFQAAEGVAFSGAVAAFTDTDVSTAADYTATIDWGDGTTSPGVITTSNGDFLVSGAHTYVEEGRYSVAVIVHDVDGSTGVATESSSAQAIAEPVTYRVTVDTSAIAGGSGFVDLQLNPGALPDAQTADVTIDQFQNSGGTLGGVTIAGNASGSLAGAVQLGNTSMLNELKQALTYGNTLTFVITLAGDAIATPLGGLFGSMLSLTLFRPDGVTPLETTAADGAVMKIALDPTGATQLLDAQGASIVHVMAVNTISVADAPLQVALVPIQAVEGTPFSGKVATFTDANAASAAADFAASILWGDGTAASP